MAAGGSCQLSSIASHLRRVLHAVHDRVHGPLQDGRQVISHAVVHPEAIPASNDEPVPSQVGEVPGGRRLRHPETPMDVADTDLPLLQQRKDAQADGVGERGARARNDVDAGDGTGPPRMGTERRRWHDEFALPNILPGTDTANTFV